MAVLLSDALREVEGAQRAFFSLADVKQVIRSSKNYERDRSPPEEAAALLLLSTSTQQTWLVATPNRLYCILDDPSKGPPKVNWSMDRSELVDDKGLRVEIRTQPNTGRTGKVSVGGHSGWLYSHALFEGRDVAADVQALILGKMTAGTASGALASERAPSRTKRPAAKRAKPRSG